MKKIIFRILPALMLLITAVMAWSGCEKNKLKLKGTTWKLDGIYDVNKKELKVLTPIECEDCYSFTFDTDSTAQGKSTTNKLEVYLTESVRIGVQTLIAEIGDGYIFYEATGKITHYNASNMYLKFFFDEGNKYLLFKSK
ncbi:MAG: hypothetical protein Q4A56_00170 [Porphyromonadaceae bacterium]|nr:hypothetical protein [Porphyromonadaceae bacterium]